MAYRVSAVNIWVCRGYSGYKSIQRIQEIQWDTIGYKGIQEMKGVQ